MSRHSSSLDAENCRNCSSFSEYVKVAKRKAQEESGGSISGSTSSAPARSDCPLDKEELGRGTWGLLHTIAAKYSDSPTKSEQKVVNDLFYSLAELYPCDHCAEDFRKDLKTDPPKTKSQEALSQWLCKLHNKVNLKTGKPKFDCSKVNERWRDGWLDGSCDY